MTETVLMLVLLGVVSFFQNMCFTLSSRSRNSGDPFYHFKCALGSNGVWFICQVLIVKSIWTSINQGEWFYVIAAGLVYTAMTALGSYFMMKILLKTEKGKKRVGARTS